MINISPHLRREQRLALKLKKAAADVYDRDLTPIAHRQPTGHRLAGLESARLFRSRERRRSGCRSH